MIVARGLTNAEIGERTRAIVAQQSFFTGNAANQSLAEATVPPGSATIEHFHRTSEEIYLFTRGMGRMHLGDQDGPVRAGDAVVTFERSTRTAVRGTPLSWVDGITAERAAGYFCAKKLEVR